MAPPDYLHYTKKELGIFLKRNKILREFQGRENNKSHKKSFFDEYRSEFFVGNEI